MHGQNHIKSEVVHVVARQKKSGLLRQKNCK